MTATIALENRPDPEEQEPYLSLDWEEPVDEEVGEEPRRLWLRFGELRPFIEFLITTERAMEEGRKAGGSPQ